ncbi:MAG: signal recognition particle-docking protein FtsY [candidate division Zixibacteria bacterium]|nr:signal recognition particle-docking protein FtsY [candidate division Zixibacteria bacterium]
MALFKKAIEHLAGGLARTRKKLVGSLRSLLAGRKIDDELLDELEEQLILADIGVTTAMRIREDLQNAYKEQKLQSGDDVIDFLKTEMKQYWPEADRSIHFAQNPPTVILVAGVNGTGKTTSVAKLAHLFKSDGKKVCLAAADTFRAAADEQLEIWAGRVGVDLIKHQPGADPAAVVYDAVDAALARKIDVLIVDTAGRLHTQKNLMNQLNKIKRVIANKIEDAPHEVLMVLDATTGQNAVQQAKLFTSVVDVTGIFLSKLDSTAKGGCVIGMKEEIDIPVKFVGLGETAADIAPFDPDTFIDAMFD